jgi:hypothetical protein
MSRRILLGPEVADKNDLLDLAQRLNYYFDGVQPRRVVIPLSADLGEGSATDVMAAAAQGGGPLRDELAHDNQELLTAIEFIDPTPGSIRTVADDADLVLMWNAEAIEQEPWREVLAGFDETVTWFNVDWKRCIPHGTFFVDAANLVDRDSRVFEPRRGNFVRLQQKLANKRRAHLVATGPSVAEIESFSVSDDEFSVVCNTAAINEDLMARVRPDVITFADPVFHFGPSRYVERFHEAVTRLVANYDTTVVTTDRYQDFLSRKVPQIAENIVGVRQLGVPLQRPLGYQNFDLVGELAVAPHRNILTLLMLPVAATFADELMLYGFDGRAPSDSGFWRHGSSVQLGDLMDTVRAAHPGFFHVDIPDYYDLHIATVDRMVSDLETAGVRISVATESMIPALAARQVSSGPTATQSHRGDPVELSAAELSVRIERRLQISEDVAADEAARRAYDVADVARQAQQALRSSSSLAGEGDVVMRDGRTTAASAGPVEQSPNANAASGGAKALVHRNTARWPGVNDFLRTRYRALRMLFTGK